MKIYLISDIPSGGDELVDVFDSANVNVVSKEILGDIEDVEAEIEKKMSSTNADLFLFVTDDPVGAGMALNKMDGVMAATCNSVEDVSSARANGANVIILGNDSAQKEEIAQAIASGGAGLGKLLKITRPQKQKRIEVERPVKSSVQPRIAEKPAKQDNVAPRQALAITINLPKITNPFHNAKKKIQKNDEEEEVELPAGKPRTGLLGKIKDELGIID
ncbi:MAG: RpiB/LacA/LacB family sugar-phosphate isomerase [Candidatus Micrarchaeales archaeon]